MIEFTVYGAPHGKGRPRFARRGNYFTTYTDDDTMDYEQLVKFSYLEKNTEKYMGREPLEMEVKVYQQILKSFSKRDKEKATRCEIRPTKKPDIDNIVKSIMDGLNKVAYADDTQIISIRCDKYYSNEPRVEVKIKLWEYKND